MIRPPIAFARDTIKIAIMVKRCTRWRKKPSGPTSSYVKPRGTALQVLPELAACRLTLVLLT